MSTEPRRRVRQTAFIALFAAILFGASQVFAQQGVSNLATKRVDENNVTVEWDGSQGAGYYDVYYLDRKGRERYVGFTRDNRFTIKGLRFDSEYEIRVVGLDGRYSSVMVRTNNRRQDQKEWQPTIEKSAPRITCPHLSDALVVTGYHASTQCVLVDGSGVGRMDLIKRGIIHALDIWGFVPNPIEVCFKSAGSLVFLDADYAPRMLMEIEAYLRDGMTCGIIDRAGTIVLLVPIPGETLPAQPTVVEPTQPTVAQPTQPKVVQPTQPTAATLPVFETIPLNDCLIKLVETLFLRATPGGEITGLVWVNSEVPAFEINGYWYKIEFEGQTGYVSRYHRKVLRGGCG